VVDEDAGGAFQMLVDRLHQRPEDVALLLESLAQKPRLIGVIVDPSRKPTLSRVEELGARVS
jgi:hypothetical protein